MRRAERSAIVAIALVLAAGVLIYSVRRSGSAATLIGVVRATEIRGGAGGERPARVDCGREGRPRAHRRCPGEALSGGVDGTGGPGACRPRVGNRDPQQHLCGRATRTGGVAEI